MKNLLLAFVFYGILYYVFEALFNYIYELFNNKISLYYKLKAKVINAPSFYMILSGALAGFIIHVLLLLPFDISKVIVVVLYCISGGIVITLIELLSGLILNVRFKLDLWDYSASKIKILGRVIPLNYKGQIDVYRSLAWCGLTLVVIIVDKTLL